MKRLTFVLIALMVTAPIVGCGTGRFFRSRGARCGVPSFRLPRLRARAEPPMVSPCETGACSAPYSMGPGEEVITSPEWTSAPIESSSAVEINHNESPIYVGKPVTTGETVISPEIAPVPSGP